ncbi:MAG: hypothetical protein JWM68_5126 [Verrucomicrobiales bacterium]|nr:hypothetical protein [Verrucomicrobiales bacterium]
MQRLNERLAEIGLPVGTVQTMFGFIDVDEGRLKGGRAIKFPPSYSSNQPNPKLIGSESKCTCVG